MLRYFSCSIIPLFIILTAGASPRATWHDFSRLLHADKGNHVAGIRQLKEYFHRFGYLKKDINFTDLFDKELQSAVFRYQENLGIPVTGELDSKTIKTIISPRCGVPDKTHRKLNGVNTTSRFEYFHGHPRWKRKPPMLLTYSFSENNTIDYLSKDEIESAFDRAFKRWSAVIPVSFKLSETYRSADIKIGFYRGDHGDGVPFDGVLGILGHAFSPEGGKLHLDKAETWAVDFKKMKSKVAVDLESVATHEIGHLLGLAHSTVPESVMYPSLSPRTKKRALRVDDVDGVQTLYGSNPNFSFSELLASENSSNKATQMATRPCSGLLGLLLFLVLF